MGGKLHLKLNTGVRPIANKYREGKMKRTLKRVKKYVKPSKGKRMDSAMCRLRFIRAGGCGSGFADLNRPRSRFRFPPPAHFSWARVNVGWNWD